jgi:hypothetical protein
MVRPSDAGLAIIAVAVMVNAANLWQLRSKLLALEQQLAAAETTKKGK